MNFSILILALLPACGGDALIGTWVGPPVPFTDSQGNTGSETDTYTFAANLNLTLDATVVYEGGGLDGCTASVNANGTYFETTVEAQDGMDDTLVGGTAQLQGCTAQSQNTNSVAISKTLLADLSGQFKYTISGKTLTLTKYLGMNTGTPFSLTRK